MNNSIARTHLRRYNAQKMVKTVVQRKLDAPVAQSELDRSMTVMAARRQFVSTALTMGWQLAGMVIIPVVIGVKLDDRLGSTPSYTLAALVLATGGAVWVISNTIKQVNKEQESAEMEQKTEGTEPKL